MVNRRNLLSRVLGFLKRHHETGEAASGRPVQERGYRTMKWFRGLSSNCLLYKPVSIFIVYLTVNVIAICIAGEFASGDKVCLSNENKEIGLNPRGNTSNTTSMLYAADIGHSMVVPGITNHIIANVIDIPLLTIPQPAGVALLGSLSMGLLIRFLRRRYQQLRPIVDYGISFVGLFISLPVVCAIAIIIKITSRGPVFYTQERVGKDGCIFNIIKFRTMNVDAESQTGPVWSGKNDPRITMVGRVLRRIHMDELPQLINVLRGEMSIIGPRPERPYFVNRLKYEVPGYTMRLSVKPGITGLAQCRHKYDETVRDVHRKLHYDMLYIKKMCWLLDIKILWNTFNISFSR